MILDLHSGWPRLGAAALAFESLVDLGVDVGDLLGHGLAGETEEDLKKKKGWHQQDSIAGDATMWGDA